MLLKKVFLITTPHLPLILSYAIFFNYVDIITVTVATNDIDVFIAKNQNFKQQQKQVLNPQPEIRVMDLYQNNTTSEFIESDIGAIPKFIHTKRL